MIRNPIFFLIDLPLIHECDEMIIHIDFVIKFGQDCEEDTASIFYVIVTFPVTKANMHVILSISEASF